MKWVLMPIGPEPTTLCRTLKAIKMAHSAVRVRERASVMGQGQAGKKLQSAGRLRETHGSDWQHHYPNVLVLIHDIAGGGVL